ncbi:MAG TPA: response regulator transcription factor [Xanthobacteraceae bacterium]|nr:response regulator transcription factor [Xanthobacteraceae bacterium]
MTLSGTQPAPRSAIVVEDIAETREWLVAALGHAFPGVVVTSFSHLAPCRDWLRTYLPKEGAPPLIALIDLNLPDGSGADLIRALASRDPRIVSIVTTIYDDDAHLFEALGAGAQGYLLKDQDEAGLIASLTRIERGEPPLSPSIARRILQRLRTEPAGSKLDGPSLTVRESEVLSLLGRGLTVGEAARILKISDHTVADHVKSIYRKLNISSRAEAAVEAMRRGLV